jgi:hypothetical protein
MILSYKNNFIFFKTQKTAGTSIQAALSTICGPDDIILGTMMIDGVLHDSHISCGQNLDRLPRGLAPKTYTEVSQCCNVPDFFSFGFVRNPYDLAVSRYHWDVTGKSVRLTGKVEQESKIEGFKDWAKQYIQEYAYSDLQHPYLGTEDSTLVDFVGRYENISEDYKTIEKLINCKLPDLTHEKSGFRDKNVHYSAYYDEETRELIYNFFKIDFKLFNYRRDERV